MGGAAHNCRRAAYAAAPAGAARADRHLLMQLHGCGPHDPVEQDEQQKVEQQQEQQGGVQVEQHTSSRRERGASIAQHEAELQVER